MIKLLDWGARASGLAAGSLPGLGSGFLGEAGLLGGHVAPLLDHGLLDPPGVPPGPAADLLGDVDALLAGLEEGDELGDVLARPLGLEVAGLLGNLVRKKNIHY